MSTKPVSTFSVLYGGSAATPTTNGTIIGIFFLLICMPKASLAYVGMGNIGKIYHSKNLAPRIQHHGLLASLHLNQRFLSAKFPG